MVLATSSTAAMTWIAAMISAAHWRPPRILKNLSRIARSLITWSTPGRFCICATTAAYCLGSFSFTRKESGMSPSWMVSEKPGVLEKRSLARWYACCWVSWVTLAT